MTTGFQYSWFPSAFEYLIFFALFSVLSHFLALCVLSYVMCLALDQHSSMNLGSFNCRTELELRSGSGYAHSHWMLLLLVSLRYRGHVCDRYTFAYISSIFMHNLRIFIKLIINFILMSPTLTEYHSKHFNLSP